MSSLSQSQFYKELQRYVLTENQLRTNGYPLEDPTDPTRAKIQQVYYNTKILPKDNQRECSRCKTVFEIDKEGNSVKEEICRYHSKLGMIVRGRLSYRCCFGSTPCSTFKSHVFIEADHTGFVKTTPPQSSDEENGVYALDTERIYTTKGMEVAQTTVIDMNRKAVYSTLIKPEGKIVDYNTRFSGIKPGDLDELTTTLKDVQNKLTEMFSDKTVLMGHSLESDLAALKMIHKTVVDTAIVFPHRRGPPLKRGLKTIVKNHLNRDIQTGASHDSQEDALAVMDLMLQRVRQDHRERPYH